MARRLRVLPPPGGLEPTLSIWLTQVAQAINELPDIVQFSGNPNTSGVTAGRGTLGIDIASTTTQPLWVNTSGATNGWSWLSYI